MKRVLILSCATGQGHNSAGLAVLDELKSRNVETIMLDPISLSGEKPSKIVSNAYNSVALHAPKLFGTAYKAAMTISSKRLKSVIYAANTLYSETLYKFIYNNDFDAIVTPHLFPAEALTFIKKHYKLTVPCYAIGTDYCCIPFWEETCLDGYFVPHKELMSEFSSRGVPENKLNPTGIPVRKQMLKDEDKMIARLSLGLNQNGRIMLLMSGSMGFGNMQSFVTKIRQHSDMDTQIVILGGNNTAMKDAIRGRFLMDEHVKVVDFTRDVPLYMDASDVLLTKPGGLTSTEAAVKHIPLVHTFPIPGCETKNAQFFSSHGLSITSGNEDGLVEAAMALIRNKNACDVMKERQKAEINRFAARDICDVIL
ncbi:MAG: glycosyltransferase [Clostridia bacterium]